MHVSPRVIAYTAAVSATLTLGLGPASVANAATPTTRIYACVTKAYKTLNLTTRNTTCPRGQRKVSWAANGRRGAKGASGVKGADGAKGADGTNGAKGDAGAAGAVGPAGSPDTPEQVLAKLLAVDGDGSGLDAQLLAGVPLNALQRRITGSCPDGEFLRSVGADGSVACAPESGGDITGVSAGDGLTGGGDSGDAELAVEVPLALTQADDSTEDVATLTHPGLGNVLDVSSPNAASAGRGISVDVQGVGPGVFSSSKGGIALWGATQSVSAAGVIGDSPRGEGVVARVGGACTDTPIGNCSGIGGVVGRNDGPGGIGVRGFSVDPSTDRPPFGVLGQAGISGSRGVAVRAENVNGANTSNALEAVTNGSGAALFAQGTQAATFNGAVQINGDLTVTGTKNGFRIDDPQAPTERTLTHTPIETDALTVQYSGNVRTDDDGRATVRLPDYAETLARDWRYQLTPIGRFGQVIVDREIEDGTFVVRSEHPRTKVSWEVSGVRQDPQAKHSPVRPVQEKTGSARGRYLDPALYGAPASRAQSTSVDAVGSVGVDTGSGGGLPSER